MDLRLSSAPSFKRWASPAAQGGGRLPEPQVAQADFGQSHADLVNGRGGAEEHDRLVDRQAQDIGDVEAFVGNLQGLAVIAAPAAGLAGHIDGRQEMHLDLDEAVALAFLAPAALDVEAEPAGAVAPDLGRRELGKQIPDVVEHPRVGGRVAPGGPADGGSGR